MERYLQRIAAPIVLFLLVVLIVPFFYLSNYSQQITTTPDNKVVYQLPYPGILPDHPLYALKAIRDKAQDILTRDNIKKAQLYLLYADKRLAMAQQLQKKGKTSLALTTLSKGEKYFLKIPPLLKQAKEQGSGPTTEVVETIKVSNQKHLESIGELLQDLPQGEQQEVLEVLKLSNSIRGQLKDFQK